ncbi:MAG: YybH family protein [Micropepsaceae bacterium]
MKRWFLIAGIILAPQLAFAANPPPEVNEASARAKIAAAAQTSRANAKTPEERAVVEADLAFAADARKRGAQAAFVAVIHPDGKMFPPRQPVVIGPEAVKALFKDDTSSWEWAPVQVAASGDLGATWGIALITGKGEDGNPFAVTTRYTTVWRRDASGKWKLWLDVGTPGPLP